MPRTEQLSASFRDPSGFLFSRNGILYRQINRAYSKDYARLMDSGLYDKLVKANLLIPHTEVNQPPAESDSAFKVIQPELNRMDLTLDVLGEVPSDFLSNLEHRLRSEFKAFDIHPQLHLVIAPITTPIDNSKYKRFEIRKADL